MLLEEFDDIGLVGVLEIQPDACNLVFVRRDKGGNVRQLFQARRTPGCPKVHNDPFSTLFGKIERRVVERFHDQRRLLRSGRVRRSKAKSREKNGSQTFHYEFSFNVSVPTHPLTVAPPKKFPQAAQSAPSAHPRRRLPATP